MSTPAVATGRWETADRLRLGGIAAVAVFVFSWLVAAAFWRLGGLGRRYDS